MVNIGMIILLFVEEVVEMRFIPYWLESPFTLCILLAFEELNFLVEFVAIVVACVLSLK